MKRKIIAGAMFLALILTSCGEVATDTNANTNVDTASGASITNSNTVPLIDQTTPASDTQLLPPVAGEEIAVMKTTMGDIKMKFFPEVAPLTVTNIKELAKKGFYNGLLFHRVIKGFMIQGGDPKGNGTGGETYNGQPMPDEISPTLKHYYGAVAMANAGPNTASSQFYIVQNKDGTQFLNGNYTIFAQVFEGMETVEKIANVETDKCSEYEQRSGCDKPKTDVKILGVTLEKYAGK